ncbi:MAG: ComF family protein [Ktedonobacterales bacterium]
MAEMGEWGQRLLDLLFPPRCVGCGGRGALLCGGCRASIHTPEPPLCDRCGSPLERVTQEKPSRCPICRAGAGPQSLTGLRVATVYEGAARQAVIALKFQGQRRAAQVMAELLADAYHRQQLHADVIIPVPLHARRTRARGYNQAELLARACGRRLVLPVSTGVVLRQRETLPQIKLAWHQRQANVAGAFALTPAPVAHSLAGKRILLIDDVATTGATMDAVAHALLAAQPAAIWGLAFARPQRHDDA